MDWLVRGFILFLPLTLFSIRIGSSRVEPSVLIALVIAAIATGLLVINGLRLRTQDGWLWPFVFFVLFAVVTLPFSPFGAALMGKAAIQVLGISVLALTSLVITRVIERRGLAFAVKPLVGVLAFTGGIGLWQFLAYNVFHLSPLADFSFLNSLLGGEVWRDPGYMGTLHRINSINAEPAHFAQFLGVGAGVALLRLGFMGRSFRAALEPVVPRWAALLILGGILVSTSLIGYMILVVTILSLGLLQWRPKPKAWLTGGFTLLLCCAAIWMAFHMTPASEDGILARLQALPLVLSAAGDLAGDIPANALSHLALSTNIMVAMSNLQSNLLCGAGLGSHPLAYVALMPPSVADNPHLFMLNADDAASLLLRLLSETGLVGAVAYISGWFLVVKRARSAIQWALDGSGNRASEPSSVSTLSLGLTASCVAMFLIYLGRMGVYYSTSIWLLLALTAIVPRVLSAQEPDKMSRMLVSRPETSYR